MRKWTQIRFWNFAEIGVLEDAYRRAGDKRTIDLDDLSRRLDRHKTNICRKARQLGLDTKYGRKMTSQQIKKHREKGKNQWNNLSEQEQGNIKTHLHSFVINGKHPRGMLGKIHTVKTKRETSVRSKKMWSDPESKVNSLEFREKRAKISSKLMQDRLRKGWNPYSDGKKGKRVDLGGQFFRSAWEANYARFLNFLGLEWEYEPSTFQFPVKRGVLTYTPDFYLPNDDVWIEIKGWLRAKDKIRLKRFKKYYPNNFGKMWIVIHDPDSETKNNTKAIAFLAGDLGILKNQLQGYNKIKKELAYLIPNWEQ